MHISILFTHTVTEIATNNFFSEKFSNIIFNIKQCSSNWNKYTVSKCIGKYAV